ncbi:MAG: UDP-N-acetylmuramyl-tripeptide synthetase [Planctomycetaceae bacterium]|nr:UDP-N-acetylmuramyl-tripeptide synthetase [Planctomycetaceae bacterium]
MFGFTGNGQPLVLQKTLNLQSSSTNEDVWINSCTCNIRTLRRGDLFVALVSEHQDGQGCDDGHDHINEAQRLGCKAILSERPISGVNVPHFTVFNSREAYGVLCQKLYGNPAENLKITAVTGTHGKTGTAFLIAGILAEAGRPVGIISSVGIYDGEKMYPSIVTTPPANELAYWFSRMTLNGCKHLVLEASDYAIDQNYFSGIEFDAVCLTNISADHLDYHQTVERYRQTKLQILHYAKKDAVVICNADDPIVHETIPRIAQPVLTVGLQRQNCGVGGILLEKSRADQTFYITAGSETMPICTRVIGESHIYNCLTAAAFGISQGIDLTQTVRGIERVESIPGRMERVECGQRFGVFIDSAQHPENLAANLATLRDVTEGKLYCIFGASGQCATSAKRQKIGETLCRMADDIVLTAESLTTERPNRSLCDMLQSVGGTNKVRIIRNRADAISSILARMKDNDCVLIVGNGREPLPKQTEESFPISERDYIKDWLYENQSAYQPLY